MRDILDRKIYDTEKAEIIFERKYPNFSLLDGLMLIFISFVLCLLFLNERLFPLFVTGLILAVFSVLADICRNSSGRKLERIYKTPKNSYFEYYSEWPIWGCDDNEFIVPMTERDVKEKFMTNYPDLYSQYFGALEEA